MTTENAGRGPSRFSYFVENVNGLKGYIEVAIDDAPIDAPDRLEWLIANFAKTGARLAAAGFKHDTSFDKPAYGGGGGGFGGKPRGGPREDPAPTDIPAPEHCGKPAVYRAEWVNRENRTIPAKFVCRADKDCAAMKPDENGGQPSRYPWDIQEKVWRQKLANDAARAAKAPAPAKSAPATPAPKKPEEPAGEKALQQFWINAQRIGWTKEQVHHAAGVETTKGFTRSDLVSLMKRMIAISNGEAFPEPWKRPSAQ